MKTKEMFTKALQNINNDRDKAKELLEEVAEYIGENPERFKDVGMVAAKYLETLQRSNEQLVKIADIVRKEEAADEGDLSEEDKEGLLDEIEDNG